MILSDKYKKFKIVSILSILMLLGWYDCNYNGIEYLKSQRKNKSWDIAGLYVKNFDSTYFYAESNTDSIIGLNYLDDLPVGESLRNGDLIQIKSIHLGGDTVDVYKIYISRTRKYKILLSIIPVFIIFYFFNKYFKFEIAKFIFKRRNNA